MHSQITTFPRKPLETCKKIFKLYNLRRFICKYFFGFAKYWCRSGKRVIFYFN